MEVNIFLAFVVSLCIHAQGFVISDKSEDFNIWNAKKESYLKPLVKTPEKNKSHFIKMTKFFENMEAPIPNETKPRNPVGNTTNSRTVENRTESFRSNETIVNANKNQEKLLRVETNNTTLEDSPPKPETTMASQHIIKQKQVVDKERPVEGSQNSVNNEGDEVFTVAPVNGTEALIALELKGGTDDRNNTSGRMRSTNAGNEDQTNDGMSTFLKIVLLIILVGGGGGGTTVYIIVYINR